MQDINKKIQEIRAKRTAKNSVFMDLFQNKSNLLKLYQTLHPEDVTATEDSLTNVTIENVMTDNLYNDLGFIANNRLLILIEAQVTWTVNVLIRILLYLAQSYHEYFQKTRQNLYHSKKVKLPKPELYVIYTGEKGNKPDVISLSKEFFEGVDIDIEVKAKVIYESGKDDIINQYIVFCKVYNEQIKLHGMTRQAVAETIRICKDRNVLKEYLESKEKEVVTIMMSLFDEDEILKTYIISELRDAAEESAKKAERKMARETAVRLIRTGGMSLEKIAECIPSLSYEELRELEAEVLQLV